MTTAEHQPFKGRIAILGAGALGAYYGARLARAGHDVHFLMRSDYEAVAARGLTVKSCDGDFHITPPVYRQAADIGPVDLVIVAIKATQNAALAELLAPVVGPATIVLTLQNGFGNEEAIAAALATMGVADAAGRVVGGVAFLCSNRLEPGVIHHSAYGWIRLAEHGGPPLARTHAIAAAFAQAGVPCTVHESVPAIRWPKLVWNIPFNGLGVAALDADTSVVLGDEALLATAVGLMEEVAAAALAADGVVIERAFIEQMVEVTRVMEAYHSSMAVDYREGRAMEVEAILGEPLRRAQAAGVSVPRLQFLYGIVRRADALNRAERAG